MTQNTTSIIIALPGETQLSYDKRNKKKGDNKCQHNYDGQDHLREKRCNFCKCSLVVLNVNKKYSIYEDAYL